MIHTNYLAKRDIINKVSSYICPECWSSVKIHKVNNTELDWVEIYTDSLDIQLARANISYNVICNKCDGFMFECDDNMVDFIVKINTLGMTTIYCCEGHCTQIITPFRDRPDNNYITHKTWVELPYIAFDINITEDQMDILDKLLSLQEYSFIEFEAFDYKYIVRAKFEYKEDEDFNDINIRFNDMKNKFFDFVRELISLLENE